MNVRFVLGIIIAPLVTPLVFSILIAGNIFGSVRDFSQAVIPVAAFAIPIAYAVALFIGVPVFLVLKKLKQLTAINVIVSATLLPSIVVLLISVFNGAELISLIKNSLAACLLVGACGFVVSGLFWVIAFGLKSKVS